MQDLQVINGNIILENNPKLEKLVMNNLAQVKGLFRASRLENQEPFKLQSLHSVSGDLELNGDGETTAPMFVFPSLKITEELLFKNIRGNIMKVNEYFKKDRIQLPSVRIERAESLYLLTTDDTSKMRNLIVKESKLPEFFQISGFKCAQDFEFTGNTKVAVLNASSFTDIRNIEITSNYQLSHIDMTGMKTCGDISVIDNDVLGYVFFNQLQTAGNVEIKNNDALSKLVMLGLKEVKSLSFKNNSHLGHMELNNLKTVSDSINIKMHPTLKNVTFKSLEDVGGSIIIEDNKRLSEIYLRKLKTINGQLEITALVQLTRLEIPRLEMIGKSLTVKGNPMLENMAFVRLTGEKVNFGITITNNKILRRLGLDELKKCKSLILKNNNELNKIYFRLLKMVDGDIRITYNPKLSELHLPVLEEVDALEISENQLLSNINIHRLQKTNGDFIIEETQRKELPLPNLYSVGGDFKLQRNSRLNFLNINSLKNVIGRFIVQGSELTSLGGGKLTSIGGSLKITDNTALGIIMFGSLQHVKQDNNIIEFNQRLTYIDLQKMAENTYFDVQFNQLLCIPNYMKHRINAAHNDRDCAKLCPGMWLKLTGMEEEISTCQCPAGTKTITDWKKVPGPKCIFECPKGSTKRNCLEGFQGTNPSGKIEYKNGAFLGIFGLCLAGVAVILAIGIKSLSSEETKRDESVIRDYNIRKSRLQSRLESTARTRETYTNQRTPAQEIA